jgi:hypothetical protein
MNDNMELHTKANIILQFFFDLLIVIGGDLQPGKSACFLIFHIWSGEESTLLKIHADHPQITLTHPLAGTINVVAPRKEKDEMHRALGRMMKIDRKSKG